MRRIYLILVITQLSLLGQSKTDLTILFTNNINGNFENCLCSDHPLGSLEKMKIVIDSLRNNISKTLLLDAGDFASPFGDQLRDTYLFQIAKLFKYDAMAVGDQEFSNGVDFFIDLSRNNKLPFTSANLKIRNEFFFPKHLLKDFVEAKILLISATFPNVFKFYDEKQISGLHLEDPVESIKNIIMDNPSDLVVLLSHNGLDNDKLLIEKLPDVHFIIGAHTQEHLTKPIKIGNKFIFQAGSDGFYLGKIEVQIRGKEIELVKYSTIPMQLEMPNDPDVTEIIKLYHFEKNKPIIEKNSYLKAIATDFLVWPSVKCGVCHEKQMEHWASTGHAQSYTTIARKGKTKLLKCLSCHVSGFGRKEGFVNLNITPNLNAVNCTECHYTLPGHKNNPQRIKTQTISSDICVRCHDATNDPEFDFKHAIRAILHTVNQTKIID